MALPLEDWLKKAQALRIGAQDRIYHKRERRPNLVIWNHQDSWSCYCQACKQGGRVMKEHVRLGDSPEQHQSNLVLPTDLIQFHNLDEHTQHTILVFLVSKGMDLCMLPTVWYSCTRKRILLGTPQGWLGRDITGNALEKWLTYNNSKYLLIRKEYGHTVVVEDPFSWYKVMWATKAMDVNVMCALGTGIKDSIVIELAHDKSVHFFFDGDKAGIQGARMGARRMQALGVKASAVTAPPNLDPKDLSAEQIRKFIMEEV